MLRSLSLLTAMFVMRLIRGNIVLSDERLITFMSTKIQFILSFYILNVFSFPLHKIRFVTLCVRAGYVVIMCGRRWVCQSKVFFVTFLTVWFCYCECV